MNNSEMKKWENAASKAFDTGKWAETMFKALGKRVASRWKFVSFRGKKGGEWNGIVDVLAIRKDTNKPAEGALEHLEPGDLFEIIIVQIKGGKAKRPSTSDIQRLKLVAEHYRAKHIVLYEWEKRDKSQGKKGKSQFSIWDGNWKPVKAAEIFG